MSFDLKVRAGDLVLNKGDLATVTNTDKLTQDILKICLTTAGANPLQPWYGSLVSKTLIGSHLQSDIIISVAKSQLQNALENLKTVQKLQSGTGQKMSLEEQISSITDVSIVRNTIDLRLYAVSVQVLTRAFSKVSASFRVSNF